MTKDYYKILNIQKTASQQDIKKAYKTLAIKYHPDKNPNNPTSEQMFKEIAEAYQVLSDPQKKQKYDMYGSSDFQNGFDWSNFTHGFDFGDIFSTFFRQSGRYAPAGRQRVQRQQHIIDVKRTMEDIYNGSSITIDLPLLTACVDCNGTGALNEQMQTCQVCNGSGQVTMTRHHGHMVMHQVVDCQKCDGAGRYPISKCKTCDGTGHLTRNKELSINLPAGVYPSGNVVVYQDDRNIVYGNVINVPDDKYQLYSDDGATVSVQTPLNITLKQSIKGCVKQINYFNGEVLDISVPQGTNPNTEFIIHNKGMPRFDNINVRGDLKIVINITVPVYSKLSKKQQKAIDQL